MNQQQAEWLLNETFNNKFDILKFSKFLKELINNSNLRIEDKSQYIAKEFRDYILKVEKLGQYKDKGEKSIELLAIKLAKHSTLERARTMQRNFIAKWLFNNSSEPEGAIVAFYDDENDWRFSFVKLEYNLIKDEKGNLKAKKELTPAKRYSYLVGPNEPNHTCKKQFVNLLSDSIDPTFEEIEHAFSIEKVTKEFFEEYKKRFLELRESLEKVVENDSIVKEEFIKITGEENLERYIVEFSKKLLGQIVFLYFLQKKGWLGVRKNKKGRFNDWGTGPKDFMKRLFNKEYGGYNNFFNDILEPLFYDTLARKRDDDYCKFGEEVFRIPFLNGGLFEPLDNYDWVKTDILLDNSIFERIFRTFDEFNFTVKEDEPLEKEVAVDPEMLGKVFENLLEVTDRKSKGAFYTPREIVHYMCQQSLINYLETNSDIPREDIEKFIQEGDSTIDSTMRVKLNLKKLESELSKGYINPIEFEKRAKQELENIKLPKLIIDNHQEIDKLLKEIKVVDPAVGSGAFPVGMMNEIVKARSILSIYFTEERNIVDIKRECIENSLYGVDIMPSAVDICQLRFWLSLVVDETDRKKIKPLPNLDNKIMCGNSLLEEFEGVKLFDDSLLDLEVKDIKPEIEAIDKEIKKLNEKSGLIARGKLKGTIKEVEKEIKKLERKKKKLNETKKSVSNITLTNFEQIRRDEAKIKLKQLKAKQKEFFNTSDRDKKKELKKEIDKLEWDLIEATLKQQGNEEALEKLESIKKSKSKPFFLWKLYFAEVFQRENPGFDVVIGNPPYGAKLSISDKKIISKKLTNTKNLNTATIFMDFAKNYWSNGVVCFIVPKSLLFSESWQDIVRSMKYKVNVLVDVEKAFEKVKLEQVFYVFDKNKNYDEYTARKFLNSDFVNTIKIDFNYIDIFNNWICDITKKEINLAIKIKRKSINLGSVSITKSGEDFQKYISQDGTFPVYGGASIQRWFVKKMKGFIDSKYLKKMKKTNKLNVPKIVSQDILAHIQNPKPHIKITSTFDEFGKLCTLNTVQNTYVFNKNISEKYILSLFHSNLINWFVYRLIFSTAIRTMHFSNEYISKIPIKQISPSEQKPFIDLVDQILSITKDDDYLENLDKQAKVKKLEKEIDQLVYKVYDLAPEEIKVVEEFGKEK